MGPLFKSPPKPLLKSGLWPLDGYDTCQETISRRPEQMYTPSDTGLEWLEEGPLYKSVLNKRQGSKLQLLLKLFSGHYLSHTWGPCSDIAPNRQLMGDLNTCILHLTQD